MSKPYQWSAGEPCVKVPTDESVGIETHIMRDGTITFVKELGPHESFDPPMVGQPIRVYGEPYGDREWSDGAVFRPLHGTDIRKLEEKFPEYRIKTNEVEG